MDLGNSRIRLAPQDEYNHPVEAASNFNESMYINTFNHTTRTGGWFRVGNRPNEGYAEMSCCVYLPDGSIGFMFQRPQITGNAELNAGGMRFEVVEPFKHLSVTYNGKVCLMDNPQDMDDPKAAFRNNPLVDCEIDIDFYGISPVYGGEMVDENDKPIEEAPEESFARAHYEQHMRSQGTIKVNGKTWTMDNGLGLRDHSWGPRYWQNLYWYRWLPMVFNPDFAVNVSIVTLASGKQTKWGMVLKKNASGDKHYVNVVDAAIRSEFDKHGQAVKQIIDITTAEDEKFTITGESLSLIPLRNRRQTPEGEQLHTRITEAMTRFECNGMVGYGMSEYLDQIVDGKAVGNDAE